MRVKRDTSSAATGSKDGDKPLTLNVNNEVPQNDSNGETGTPLLFDSNDFLVNSELAEMMPYNPLPFFSTSMYPYGDYQGQYPGFPIDPETYESLMSNPLFSPDGSTVTADDDGEVMQSELPMDRGSRELIIPSSINNQNVSAVVAPNLEKYSLKVKVRHPERAANTIRGNNKVSTPTVETRLDSLERNSLGVNLDSAIHTENVTGSHSSNPDTVNFIQSSLPTKNISKTVINKVIPNDDSNLKDTVNDKYQDIIATPVPPGSIVLNDGTVLIPTDQQPGKNVILQEGPVSSVSSNILDDTSKVSLPVVANLNNSFSKSVPNQSKPEDLSVVAGHVMNTDFSFLHPDISSTSSMDHIEETVTNLLSPNSSLESTPPKPSQTVNLSPRKSNSSRKSKALKKEQISPHTSTVVVESTNKSKKGVGKRSVKSDMEESINGNAQMLTSKLTPVSKITNIVGTIKKDEIDENDILKEAVSKPIKHRTDIRDADSAQERSIKNAINARVNRQKHKVYVQTLEEENNGLKDQVSMLQSKIDVLVQEKDLLNSEVVYLKKVIANESSLSNVLSGLKDIQDVTLSSSFAWQYRKRPADSSQDQKVGKKPKQSLQNPQVTGGVCIHVTGTQASLELCQKCAEMASTSVQP